MGISGMISLTIPPGRTGLYRCTSSMLGSTSPDRCRFQSRSNLDRPTTAKTKCQWIPHDKKTTGCGFGATIQQPNLAAVKFTIPIAACTFPNFAKVAPIVTAIPNHCEQALLLPVLGQTKVSILSLVLNLIGAGSFMLVELSQPLRKCLQPYCPQNGTLIS